MKNISHSLQRFLEILPALATWATLLLPILLTPFLPRVVAVLILAFDVWWFLRLVGTNIYLFSAFKKFKRAIKINWAAKLQIYLRKNQRDYPHHIILMATYKEPAKLVAQSITTWAAQKYPREKLTFVLATEAREGEAGRQKARELTTKFSSSFGNWLVTSHPDDLPDEIPGRGSNATFAMHEVEKWLRAKNQNWDPKRVLVTTVDADSQATPHFLAYLTLKFFRAKNRIRKSFQPLPFYFNNLWQVPAFTRLIAIGSTMFHLMNSVRPHQCKNFSAFTYTLWMLRKIDYYPVDTPVEDYRTFYRAYIKNAGKTDVVPLHLPISMDAVDEDTFWKTVRAQYIQIRRWASGASHLAWFVPRWLADRDKYPFGHTLWEAWENLFVKSWTWATAPLLLMSGAWIPLLNNDFADTILGYNFPIIIGRILTLMLLGIFISIIMNYAIIEAFQARGRPRTFWRKLLHILEWVLVPPITIIFGALPAIDAQTRLAFGKIVRFDVTKKKR